MRYLVALVVSTLLAGAFVVYHWWLTAKLAVILRQAQVQARQAGFPAETPATDFGVQLSGGMTALVDLDHFIVRFWFPVLPLMILLCFGVASRLPRRQIKSVTPPASSGKIDPNS